MKTTIRPIFAFAFALGATPVFGGTSSVPTRENLSNSDLLTRDYFFGDWFGRRTSLKEKGYQFTFNYTADTQRNFSG